MTIQRGLLLLGVLALGLGEAGRGFAQQASPCCSPTPTTAVVTPCVEAEEYQLELDLFGGIRPRGVLGYEVGDAPGRDGGLGSLQLFLPFEQDCQGNHIAFMDNRLLFFDDRGTFAGCNVGLGGRFLDRADSRLYGGYLYYDYRDTGRAGFDQVAGGFETLGDVLDARANFYIPVGGDRKVVNNGAAVEQALAGFDLEAGARFYANSWLELRGFAGVYHYQGEGVSDIWGPRFRLEARACDSASLYVSVQNDRVFDTTVNFGVIVSFPRLSGRSYKDGPAAPLCAAQRLGDPVFRTQHIAVRSITP